jgi:N-carbamoylputrescine amidase
MISIESHKLKVAAIQLTPKIGCNDANNQHAMQFIERAAEQGAKLVILPEMYSSGYLATPKIWKAAETTNGPTAKWLKETSKRLSIFLGTGFIETDGEDFYNSYMISSADGEIVGVCRKNNAEAYAFMRGKGPHVFETTIGKIGIGICADNQFAFLPKLMHEESVDIMLMPHAAPLRKKIAHEKTSDSDYKEIEAQYDRMKNLPHIYAKMLGIPVIFATQYGTLERLPGIIGKVMTPDKWCIPGLSRIVDSDNTLRMELGDIEDVAIADVTLDQARKDLARNQYDEDKKFNGFSQLARKVIFPIDGIFARNSYNNSKLNWKHNHE